MVLMAPYENAIFSIVGLHLILKTTKLVSMLELETVSICYI